MEMEPKCDMSEEDGSETAGDEDIMEVMQKVEIIRRRMANVDADEEEQRRRRRRAEADALIARLGQDKVRYLRLNSTRDKGGLLRCCAINVFTTDVKYLMESHWNFISSSESESFIIIILIFIFHCGCLGISSLVPCKVSSNHLCVISALSNHALYADCGKYGIEASCHDCQGCQKGDEGQCGDREDRRFPNISDLLSEGEEDLGREWRGQQLGFSMSSPRVLPRNEVGIIKRIGNVGGSGDAVRQCQGGGQEEQDEWRDHCDVCVRWRSVIE